MSSIPTMNSSLSLSEDQQAALQQVQQRLKDHDEAILVGPAGTGKTTLMREFLSQWQGEVHLMAPTGKAALRLMEVTGRNTSTVHRALYQTSDELEMVRPDGTTITYLVFGKAKPPVPMGGLAVVDEASMVGSSLYADFMEQLRLGGGSVLWVGDKAQLEPVNDTWGPNLDESTAELTQIHRQAAGSPVLKLATLTRRGQANLFDAWGDEVSYVDSQTLADAMQWAGAEPDRMVLTWTNRVRHLANRVARVSRGFTGQSLMAGELILVRQNNHAIGVMNGEVLEVESVVVPTEAELYARLSRMLSEPLQVTTTCGRAFYIDGQGLSGSTRGIPRGGDLARSIVQAEYGYCLTTHSAQGSQWREVRFLLCPGLRRKRDNADKLRLLYTAVTRASERFIYHTL